MDAEPHLVNLIYIRSFKQTARLIGLYLVLVSQQKNHELRHKEKNGRRGATTHLTWRAIRNG